MTGFLSGYGLGLSLIVAIGAQNAFVLRQGLLREHVFWVCLVCGLSDAVLIAVGVAGMGAAVQAAPVLNAALRWGGAAFLLWYGARAMLSALRGGQSLQSGALRTGTLRSTILTLLALTWLNPHVYLDTVVLVGSISAQYPSRLAFGAGAVCASVSFFFALGYGARLLSPVFARPRAWQILDAGIALVMWAIAAALVVG